MELLLQACMTILGLIASQFDGAQQLENGATSAQHTMPQREDMGRLRSARLRLTVASMRMTQGLRGGRCCEDLRGAQRLRSVHWCTLLSSKSFLSQGELKLAEIAQLSAG